MRPEERLLNAVSCLFFVAQDAPRDPQQAWPVPPHEVLEGASITGAKSGDLGALVLDLGGIARVFAPAGFGNRRVRRIAPV